MDNFTRSIYRRGPASSFLMGEGGETVWQPSSSRSQSSTKKRRKRKKGKSSSQSGQHTTSRRPHTTDSAFDFGIFRKLNLIYGGYPSTSGNGDSGTSTSPLTCQINLPDTIELRKGRPIAWYYTCKLKRARSWDRMNQPGYIVSKSAQDDIEQILQTFSQPMGEVPVDEGAICSILLYETKQHDSKSRTYIEFLTQSSLEEFIRGEFGREFGHSASKTANCILQRFVWPMRDNDHLLRFIWSTGRPKIQLRSSNYTLTDSFGSYHTVAWEEDYHLDRVEEVYNTSGEAQMHAKAQCDQIAYALKQCYGLEKIKQVNPFGAMFKVCNDEMVYLSCVSYGGVMMCRANMPTPGTSSSSPPHLPSVEMSSSLVSSSDRSGTDSATVELNSGELAARRWYWKCESDPLIERILQDGASGRNMMLSGTFSSEGASLNTMSPVFTGTPRKR